MGTKKADFDENHDSSIEKTEQLRAEIRQIEKEKNNLSGLFTGKKRKELDGKIAYLRKELDMIVIPEDPGKKPEKPKAPEKGKEPKRENFRGEVSNGLIDKYKEQVKCSLSPSYRERKKLIERLKDTNVGEIIRFGEYPTEYDGRTGPIEWKVLAKRNDRLLVIRRFGLDCQPYQEDYSAVTWDQSSLRNWLNTIFLNKAFSADEQAMIPIVAVSADKNPIYNTDPGRPTQDKVDTV